MPHQPEAAWHRRSILYRFTTNLDRQNRFILTELRESEEHLKAHFAGEALRNFWAPCPREVTSSAAQHRKGPLAAYFPSRPPQ
jgi:quinol monooxygenase YgiN